MIRRTHALTLALATAVAAGPALAQGKPVRNTLPPDTIFYVSAPDIASTLKQAQGSPLMQMWKEAEVQDFFADALKMLETEWKTQLEQGHAMHQQGMLPFSPDELMKLRLEGFTAAVTSLDLTAGDGEPMPKFGIVAHLDFGESAPIWKRILQFGMSMMEAQSQGMLVKETGKVGEIELITFVPPETDMSLNVAFHGNTMVIGTLKDEVQGMLTRIQAGEAALSSSKNFTTTFSKLDGNGAELEAFVQPGPAVKFAMKALQLAADTAPDFPPMIDIAGIGRALDALGVYSIKAAGSTTSYQIDQETEKTFSLNKGYTYSPVADRKGLFAGTTRPLDTKFLRWIPSDVSAFSASTFDLSSIWDGLVGALNAYDEETAKQLLGMLGNYEKNFGISIKDDLLGSFGDEIVTWSMPIAALGTTPEMAFVIKIKDQERLLKTLRTVAKLSDGMFDLQESERRGIKVYQIYINWDPTGGMGGMNPLDMFTPTLSFKDGYMVAGFTTGDVKRVFKRMDREDDPAGDIRSNPEFKPYLKMLPQQGLGSLSFSDWKANFEGGYQLVTSLAAFIPVDDSIPIDLSLLPDVATLTQHLYGAVSWTTSDENGYTTMAVGPWGPEAVGLLAGVVAAGSLFWVSTVR